MKFFSTLLISLPLALALPSTLNNEDNTVAAVDKRQCYVQCGSKCYTSSQVSAARTAGYNYYRNGQQVGSNDYPHQFNNREGFNFLVGGTYQEFPLLSSGTYSGGSPGADRVVFNTNGQRAGEITHTGASGNNFVKCSGW